ncbi:hypothetical protein EV360DRAFT_89463 [Lentinula raphanica]|nr:hypothetical protein EV360DRAFT_89463 [Lentinula raphanica]
MSSFLPVSYTALAPPKVNTRLHARLGESHLPETINSPEQNPSNSPVNSSPLPSHAPTPLQPRSPEPVLNLQLLPHTLSLSPTDTPFSQTQPDPSVGGLDTRYRQFARSYTSQLIHDGALLRNTSKLPAMILVARPSIIHLDVLRYMQEIYFKTKNVTDVDEKKRIMLDEGFTHDLAFDWIHTNRDHLLSLAWEDTGDCRQ